MLSLNDHQLREIADFRADHCVSLFLPTWRSGPDQQQNAPRLHNLWKVALERLLARHVRRPDAEALLAPLEELRIDGLFWRSSQAGLACYCAEGLFRKYWLPAAPKELVCVGERFRVEPLLDLVPRIPEELVLALTHEGAQLYHCTRDRIRQLELPPVIALKVDGRDETLQLHTQHTAVPGGQTSAATFHGHGGPADRAKADLRQFFARVDAAVSTVISELETPLVLACDEPLAPLYRSINTYRVLSEFMLPGSPAHKSMGTLHQEAVQLMERQQTEETEAALARLRDKVGVGIGSTDLRHVVLAADDGRVDTLFVTRGAHQWGRINHSEHSVELCEVESEDADQQDDLLDFAASRTLSCGGDVEIVDQITGCESPVAAIYRF